MGGRSLVSGGGEGRNDTIGIIDGEENKTSIVPASSSEGVNTSSGMGGETTGVEGSGSGVTGEGMWRAVVQADVITAGSEGVVGLRLCRDG